MMSKSSYLTDSGQNGPHITFYVPTKDYAAWGANLAVQS